MTELEEIKFNINLRSVKSLYIIDNIFSFLNEKQILNIIIYNKKLQKMLLVDLEDYQEIKEKYKIGERNGKVKEYYIYNDELIFEGEYLDGERNGKGKEYDYDGKLEFEGEYLNGKKNGKGKEYCDSDKLQFEGEYLNGKRNGKGKEYYDNAELKYEGEYLNGKIWNGN